MVQKVVPPTGKDGYLHLAQNAKRSQDLGLNSSFVTSQRSDYREISALPEPLNLCL